MIQPNELRIGNWVTDAKLHSYIQFKSFFGLCNAENKPEDYEPIPLTPEILEKAGFKDTHEDFVRKVVKKSKYGSVGLEISLKQKRTILFTPKKVLGIDNQLSELRFTKCLHQLQNLFFALTGEELQIEL